MNALLDTSILISIAASDETTPDLTDFANLYVSSLTWNELTLGMHQVKSLQEYKRRAARIQALKKTLGRGLPFDDDCDEMYDELLVRVGQRSGTPKAHRFDRMIAATAMAHELVLVTRNGDDFKMFEGMLDVVVC